MLCLLDDPRKRKTGRLLDGGMEWQWMGARCVVGSSWCYYMTDLARREFFLLLLQASMPAAMTMASTGFSSRIFAPLAASLQDPRGLVPPKWTGRLRATATGLAIALVWAALRCRAMFALTVWW